MAEQKRGRGVVEFVVTAKDGQADAASSAQIEVTKATWGSKIFKLGEKVEVDAEDAGWFQSRYGALRSGPAMPLYLKKVEAPVFETPSPAPTDTEEAPAPRKGRR